MTNQIVKSKKKIKLSIIIPVYNVQDYVAKCINSCLNQDIDKDSYEIIIINDGSTDESLSIIEEIQIINQSLILYSQNNGGLSSARNKGLSISRGEYVWFVDSDDYISEVCLKQILDKLIDVDCLAMPYTKVFRDISKNRVVELPNNSPKSGIDLINNSFLPAQFFIYNKQFLVENNLNFESGILHEDLEFVPRMLYYAKTVTTIDEPVYFLLCRDGSITNTKNIKRTFDYIKIANKLISFQQNTVVKKYKYLFYDLISLAVNNALNNLNGIDYDEKVRKLFFENKNVYKYMLLSKKLKYKLEAIIFLLFPNYCIENYRLIHKIFKIKNK